MLKRKEVRPPSRVYTIAIWNVFSTLDGQVFVWNSDKAARNVQEHGIRFEQAREVFLDQLARYEDASPSEEARQACIGLTTDYRLLYVVHVI